MSEEHESICEGSLTIYGVEIHVHVLDNGVRVIAEDDIVKLFNAMADPNTAESEENLRAFAAFVKGVCLPVMQGNPESAQTCALSGLLKGEPL